MLQSERLGELIGSMRDNYDYVLLDAAPILSVADLFRTTFSFPANVTTGVYNVDVFLLRKGRIVSTRSRALTITKVGVGASIFDFAHQHAPIYGIMAVVVALFAGWLAGALFRKT